MCTQKMTRAMYFAALHNVRGEEKIMQLEKWDQTLFCMTRACTRPCIKTRNCFCILVYKEVYVNAVKCFISLISSKVAAF